MDFLAGDVYRLHHRKFPLSNHASANSERAGVSIMIKYTLAFQIVSSSIDTKGRYIILYCVLNSKKYNLLSLYAHQLYFIKRMVAKAKKKKKQKWRSDYLQRF